MKKKILALCLVVVLAVTAITGATLAYFTDDEQATNVMTIGNVEINIEEHVKAMNEDKEWVYAPFVDEQFTLYPVANEKVGSDWNAHYNKVVRTFNTSTSGDAAYIRTIVLLEKNDVLPADFANQGGITIPGLHTAHLNADATTVDGYKSHATKAEYAKDADGNNLVVTVDGEEYWVVVFTAADEKAIPYGEALHSLNAVWMDKNVTSDQIAGWGTDGKVNIIVYSQGIQSYDLNHADAMAALGTVDQALINTLAGANVAAENDYTNN